MVEKISLVGLSISLFTMVTIFTRSKIFLADKLLGVWLVLICIPMLETMQISFAWYNPLFNLLHGPLLFFYVRVLTQVHTRFVRSDLLHLAPFILLYLLSMSSELPDKMVPGAQQALLDSGTESFSGIDLLLRHFGLLNVGSFLIYSAVVVRLLIQHRQRIDGYFSRSDTQISLSWIYSLPVSFLAITLLNLFNEHSVTELAVMQPLTLHLLSHTCLAVLLCFFGVQQKPVFTQVVSVEQPLSEPTQEDVQEVEVPKQQLLESDVVDIYKAQIDQYMQQQRAFLDPDFSVYALADALDIPRRSLSFVLSHGFNKNFYQFVNGYRLQEMRQRLTDSDNRDTILDIGLACGFSSKSTYNALFKKQCGCTPTQFRKLAQKGGEE